ISETHRLIQESIDDNELLAEWWNTQGADHFAPDVDRIVDTLSEFGEFLGEELAVVGYAVGGDDFDGPLVMAEIVDPAGLRDFAEQQLEELTGSSGHPELVFVEDPFSPSTGAQHELFVWLSEEGIAVASAEADQITRVADILINGTPNPFVDSEFYAAIAELYDEGAEIVVAADLEGVVNTSMAGEAESDRLQMERLGFLDAQFLLVEQKQLGTKTHHRANLTFKEARSGLASWLAAPAPMGALDYISPDAQLVGAFVFKDPAKLMEDVYSMMDGQQDFGPLTAFDQRHSFSLKDDVAASLGGEFAIALDGPLLPEPSWKAVIEVYEPARLQWAFEESLAELNAHLQQAGSPAINLVQEEVGGRLFYHLDTEPIGVHYTYVEGYLLMGSNRTLLDQAIRFRDSGYSITDSARFTALMPADGRNNFSGLLYQDLSGVMKSVAERLAAGQMTEEQKASLESMAADSSPTLGYAYGEENSILIAASSENDALSSALLYMLGMKNPAGFEQLFKGL
ncbi:MAG: hypothetical protein AAF657_36790, partial [Acidobacteriota bacterium]